MIVIHWIMTLRECYSSNSLARERNLDAGKIWKHRGWSTGSLLEDWIQLTHAELRRSALRRWLNKRQQHGRQPHRLAPVHGERFSAGEGRAHLTPCWLQMNRCGTRMPISRQVSSIGSAQKRAGRLPPSSLSELSPHACLTSMLQKMRSVITY